MSGPHNKMRKVNESEVQFATRVRWMVNHSCDEEDFFVVFFVLFLLLFFFQNHLSGCLSGEKISKKKKKQPWKRF